jgi:hypothetical protein
MCMHAWLRDTNIWTTFADHIFLGSMYVCMHIFMCVRISCIFQTIQAYSPFNSWIFLLFESVYIDTYQNVHMHTHMHIKMCTCIRIFAHVYAHAHAYACVCNHHPSIACYLHQRQCVYMYWYLCLHVLIFMSTCTDICVYMYWYLCPHVLIFVSTCTDICAYMYWYLPWKHMHT